MHIKENIQMAFRSLWMNKLRASLTMTSIIVGIFSIIGSMTALGILTRGISDSLSQLGNETFTVQKFPSIQMGGAEWMKYLNRKSITYDHVKFVREFATLPLAVSAEHELAPITVSYKNEKSDPQFNLYGSDENFATNHNFTIKEGRMLTRDDVEYARDVAVLGGDIVKRIFKDGRSPIGASIRINEHPYEVIGVFETKGGGGGASQDKFALVPITNEQKNFVDKDLISLNITVRAVSPEMMEATQDEIIGLLRAARGVKPGAENDFEVESNTSLNLQFESFSKYIVYAGVGISAIALLAASIGIMNIMLVSVTERTKEIGLRQAVGAKTKDILSQFLVEAVTLSVLGGTIGIILGVSTSYLLTYLAQWSTKVSWSAVALAFLFSALVGVFFGYYPARKAAYLDPIEALRYE